MTTTTPLAPDVLELDAAVTRVAARKAGWVREPIPRRLAFLRDARQRLLSHAEAWVRTCCGAKGIEPGTPVEGEEWLAGPMTTARHLRLMIEALEAGGAPAPTRLRTLPDGRIVADVFPHTLLDRAVYLGFSAEVWMRHGHPASQGAIYREKQAGRFGPGALCAVLGAGNVSSIPPLDVLHKLFVEDEVVVLKMNPVNAYLAPLFREMFEGLIDAGYLAIIEGGAAVGQALVDDPRVDSVHLTGSDRTHDAIVWGATAEEQERRKQAGTPRLLKRVSSELGCVTPVLVVPGPWTRRDLETQAMHVASMVANNASFNCNAAKVLVLARGWDRRDAFLERLDEAFLSLPPRVAYYPGAADRHREFVAQYPNARLLGMPGPGALPWTLLPRVPPDAGEYALTREAFCTVLAEVSLDVEDPEHFLDEAVTFVNSHVWGNLSACVLIDPATERRYREAFFRAIDDLHYGTIAVNGWGGVGYGLAVTPWGAFPGNPLENIRSGHGMVHNGFMFDHPLKAVVRVPFRPFPKPVWFANHRTLAELGRLATHFEANPSWAALPRLALTGVRG
ncbi:MAG: aldehyde dehydrogenase family protein [Vicinamibacteraceae bacterium]|nr:aldehyde dehydrogenase family protein [Vicinamibacteraceae bacterium]